MFAQEAKYDGIVQCKKNIEDILSEIRDHRREVRLALRLPGLDYTTVMGTEVALQRRSRKCRRVLFCETKKTRRLSSIFILHTCVELSFILCILLSFFQFLFEIKHTQTVTVPKDWTKINRYRY